MQNNLPNDPRRSSGFTSESPTIISASAAQTQIEYRSPKRTIDQNTPAAVTT